MIKRVIKLLLSKIAPNILKRKAVARLFNKTGIGYDGCWLWSKVLGDVLKMEAKYGYSPEEYIGFGFADKPMDERLEFVNDKEHLKFADLANPESLRNLFDDKYQTYVVFKSYYGREMMNFVENSKEKFYDFANRHKRMFVKLHNGALGYGCCVVDTEKRDAKNVFSEICAEMQKKERIVEDYFYKSEPMAGFVAEEIIESSPELAVFHPQSLNTLRVVTLKASSGDVHVMYACLRMGRGESIVDNASAGGILCSIDISTGEATFGVDELGHCYECHPDSGKRICGFKIPRWEECVRFVKELATVVDDLCYGSWDVALTKSGWCMVEGNINGQFIWQYPLRRGCRTELGQWFMKYGSPDVADKVTALLGKVRTRRGE